MGFFDKAKQFMGGKNMADVVIAEVERQPGDAASMPVGDSVVKGAFFVNVKEDCELLKTVTTLSLRYFKDGQSFDSYAGESVYPDPNPNVSYSDDFPKLPMKMTAGQSLRMTFLVHDVDLRAVAAKSQILDANGAAGAGAIKLVVKCVADVKGSPFDPSSETLVTLLPS